MKTRKPQIREFILSETEDHERDIVTHASQAFGISRQATHKHIKKLIESDKLIRSGSRKNPIYELKEVGIVVADFKITKDLAEDIVWSNIVEPKLPALNDNVFRIAHFAFTEILNNAVDHSEGRSVRITVSVDATKLIINIEDDGIGIFHKLKERFGLNDVKHGIFELAKGRLTTDPARHSGEGIFWTSRMVNEFSIRSGHLCFSSNEGSHVRDWLLEDDKNHSGTSVRLKISLNSKKTTQNIFEQFAPASDNYGFTHTHLPVSLAKVGRENLVSRSQAKRFLQRVEKFRDVIVDFSGVEEIGQAFADEIFRVFATQHPDIKIRPIDMSPPVEMMVMKALALKNEQLKSGGSLPQKI